MQLSRTIRRLLNPARLDGVPGPCILVVGPESSGTRLLTRLLSSHPDVHGCEDAERHVDALDSVWSALAAGDTESARVACAALPSTKWIVTRRSMPHGAEPGTAAQYMQFPDIEAFCTLWASLDRRLIVLVTSRSPAANLVSWTRSRASSGGRFNRALAQYQAAYVRIFELLARHRLPFLIVSLEGLVLDGENYLHGVLDLCGLPPSRVDASSLREPNASHYETYFGSERACLLDPGDRAGS